jgi:arginase
MTHGTGITRRDLFAQSAAAGIFLASGADSSPAVDLIAAPSNLGLRPPSPDVEPGTWRAPEVLLDAGLAKALTARKVAKLPRPPYRFEAQPGTKIRNGRTIQEFSERIASEVRASLESKGFPIVVGGDCSVLLGGLLGLRRAGGRGLVHVDGHSDFFHPGNYDTKAHLGAVAGMDLAIATGRGEELLARWAGIPGPLAEDADVVQLGERNAYDPNFSKFYGDVVRTGIKRMNVQDVLKVGVENSAREAMAYLHERGLDRCWLHVDLDVVDQSELPAVDSPGSPGLTFAQLSTLLAALRRSGRIAGANVAIYDPSLDPTGRYAKDIVACVGRAFGPG